MSKGISLFFQVFPLKLPKCLQYFWPNRKEFVILLRKTGCPIVYRVKRQAKQMIDKTEFEQIFRRHYDGMALQYNFNAIRSKYKGTGAGNDKKNRL